MVASTTVPSGLYQALVEQVADAVIFADRAGLIQVWNAGAEAIFGHPAEHVLGRRLDVVIPERLRSAHWAAFDSAVDTGRMKYGRESMTTRSMHSDGRDLYIDLSFALVRDAAGEIVGSVAMARDITARFQAEKASRKRLAELQARVDAEPREG